MNKTAASSSAKRTQVGVIADACSANRIEVDVI
jgi:hypothetical protein